MITAALIWLGGAAAIYLVAKKYIGVLAAEALMLLWLLFGWSVAGGISFIIGYTVPKYTATITQKLDSRDGAYITIKDGKYRYYVNGVSGEDSVSQESAVQIFEEDREGATLKTTTRFLPYPENLLFLAVIDFTFEFRVPRGGIRNPQIKRGE